MTQSLYDRDFYSWAYHQSILLRERRFDELDLLHLSEEIEDLGKRHYDQLESHLMQIIAHLQHFAFLFRTSIATLTRVWMTNAVRNAYAKCCIEMESSTLETH